MEHVTDCLIVGGGIAGVTAAAALAPHMDVTLLEAEANIGYHASGRSAAMFLRDYGNATVCDLNYASEAAHIEQGVLSPRSMVLLGRADDPFDADCAALKMTEVSVSQASHLLPIIDTHVVTRAALTHASTALDTDLALQAALRSARGNGATLRTQAPVISASHTGGRWTLATAKGQFTSKILVNAAGAWADTLAQFCSISPIGLTPYRRSMAQLPAPRGYDIKDWPFTLAAGDRWYAKPIGGRWCVSPSEEDPTHPHDAYSDDMTLAEGLARYEDMVTAPVTRLEGSWAGLRTFAPDRALVIGPDANEPSFFWLAGQGGYGFQTSPAAANLLASHILGSPTDLANRTVAALHPNRF
ncbi:FAD-binding oxidoreductase [Nereida sp. MMG025]|uniref:NAD(P)/FAD-dependent oxidoreductase n=1 Tax=Nereida sp. MMG025 TaxID=2909981 RepID=UPI001F30F360|nr:FAD-binding oxidoreductase [Nereida sp. MMG025]MCF6444147.1 FAD-binding oxidoreductase [Nereida sp. MMG025]